MKCIKSEIYKYVYTQPDKRKSLKWCYKFTFKNTVYGGSYETERESALQCDLKLINLGKQPINILKPLNK